MRRSRRTKVDPSTDPAMLGRAFRTEWIDFERGIRMGNLEPHERITQIMKAYLQGRYDQPFICDKWGRGSFWQWICWVPRLNREAKPISRGRNWCSAKFFISAFSEAQVLKCGMQVERGPAAGPERFPGCVLKPDWDWHRLMAQLKKGSKLDGELSRLLRADGFEARLGNWDSESVFNGGNYRSAGLLKRGMRGIGDTEWAGFQLYYPMIRDEVCKMQGSELVQGICAVFAELEGAMNCVMEVRLTPSA